MTERVVITGLGVVSCLGNNAAAVKDALFNGRSGISLRQDHVLFETTYGPSDAAHFVDIPAKRKDLIRVAIT